MSIRAREATMGRVAGIDVGKASLDVSLAGGPVRQFANTAEGRLPLLQWLGQQAVTVKRCASPRVGTNARWSPTCRPRGCRWWWRIPRGCGRLRGSAARRRRRTCSDAQVLARYGACGARGRDAAAGPVRGSPCGDLVSRRRQLVETRVQEKNRRDQRAQRPRWPGRPAGISPGWTGRLRGWRRRSSRRWPTARSMARRAQLYRSVRGVGEVTAAVLTAYLPDVGADLGAGRHGACRPGALGARQRSAAGLSRHSRWTRDGAARVVHWRPWRRCATRGSCSGSIRACGSVGKPGKVALVAVMRKLLLHLNAVARRGTPWIEEPVPAA